MKHHKEKKIEFVERETESGYAKCLDDLRAGRLNYNFKYDGFFKTGIGRWATRLFFLFCFFGHLKKPSKEFKTCLEVDCISSCCVTAIFIFRGRRLKSVAATRWPSTG